MKGTAAIIGMSTGALVMIIWEILGHYYHGIFMLYSLIPGFFANMLMIVWLTAKEDRQAKSLGGSR